MPCDLNVCHRIKATTENGTEGNEEEACGMLTFFSPLENGDVVRGHARTALRLLWRQDTQLRAERCIPVIK